MQKLADIVAKIEHVLTAANFVYVAMVIVYDRRWIFILVSFWFLVYIIYTHLLDGEKK